MGYTTYDFYSKKYYGNSIGESLFPKWNDRASTKLDQLTFGNINEDTCCIKLIIRRHTQMMKLVPMSNRCLPEAGQSASAATRLLWTR